MGVDPVTLIWQDPNFLVEVVGREVWPTDKKGNRIVNLPSGRERGVLTALVNSRLTHQQIRKHLEELTRDLVKLANSKDYPVHRDDPGLAKMFWKAAAESFVDTTAKSRLEKSIKFLTDSTIDRIAHRGPDLHVIHPLKEMAKAVYVLAGAIKLGYYTSARSFEGSSVFHALPGKSK